VEKSKAGQDDSVAILLPTYCEAENIENIICTIEKLGINSRIIVIDDSSPDGTGEIVKNCKGNMEI
jgi:dolichol-phosphate mannosyltransferase